MSGQIIKIISNLYSVKVNNEVIECRARGKFRQEKITPLVGDQCQIDYDNKYILEIKPRKNYLVRPAVANVDMALIITSVKKPNLSLQLLDKLIAVVSIHNIEPVLCFSKLDLLNQEELAKINKIMDYYQKIGYKVLKNTELDNLKNVLKNKIIVITGQTGAGKSTLLNKLNPDLNLKTNEISASLGRGKHTTRHVELFNIADFYIADTPGFSSLDLDGFTSDDIKNSFKEFANYSCQFRDCRHDQEKNCGVKDAVKNEKILDSRYDNYLSLIKKNKREL